VARLCDLPLCLGPESSIPEPPLVFLSRGFAVLDVSYQRVTRCVPSVSGSVTQCHVFKVCPRCSRDGRFAFHGRVIFRCTEGHLGSCPPPAWVYMLRNWATCGVCVLFLGEPPGFSSYPAYMQSSQILTSRGTWCEACPRLGCSAQPGLPRGNSVLSPVTTGFRFCCLWLSVHTLKVLQRA
jgi:hypothetical protein